ncbi:stress responsive alpha/beta barrel protein [Glaciihabitans tibetensis]|uniref:Stress responsive alpha/beta barrel protein n=1 Tax=Glaciihabitans tibetensis TaxID=1266600 RepID=A0A2T0V9Z8_9MICO|nr:Dabb family protein [Glaciihabitans tibetensis]PRY67015.1 stress responsive alpha/beta barrel protein [Glaciihabitans tibetensis]
MIKHIVTWKLKAADESAKATSHTAVAGALLPLASSVPGVLALTVARNAAYPESNWDIVLVAEYATFDDLEAYQVHPEHQAAAAIVRQHVAERASIDFEF